LPTLKVLKLSTRGSLVILSPLAFAEGLFYLLNYFYKKEGFLKLRVEYNLKVSSTYYFNLKRAKRGKRKNLCFR
jgi:hypothetical protein